MNGHAMLTSHDALHAALGHFLHRIPGPCRLLVAVSGGSDSKGLLVALHSLLPDLSPSITLAAATIDHGLRPEAAKEAQDVANLCARLGIPHTIRRWDGTKPKTGLSAASRQARYRLLTEAADQLSADVIVTGHTADDQLETITMRKQRSSTQDAIGLSGMADHVLYRNRIWIYRPLLKCRRQVIRDFLSAQGMAWVDDPSNTNPHYERARVRASLPHDTDLPPAPARAERSHLAAQLIKNAVQMPAPGVITINNDAFEAPPQIVRHALQALIAAVGGQSHGPSDHGMTRILALFQKPNGARTTLGRCLAHRYRQGVLLVREARDVPSTILSAGDTLLWDGRWQIKNCGSYDLCVTPTDSYPKDRLSDANAIPASIVTLGHQSVPQLRPVVENMERQMSAHAQCQPVISPYFEFLPGFDWPLAAALAGLLGAKPFFPPDF